MRLPRAELHKLALAASAAIIIPMALYPAVSPWALFIGALSLVALLSDGRAPKWMSRALVAPSLVASTMLFAALGAAMLYAFGLSPVVVVATAFLALSLFCLISLLSYLRAERTSR